jgi:hypothetical protein
MCTTRELVAQNLSVLRKMAKFAGITSTSTSEEGEDTAGARGRKLIEQVRSLFACLGTSRTAARRCSATRLLLPEVPLLLLQLALLTAVLHMFCTTGHCRHARPAEELGGEAPAGRGPHLHPGLR